MTNSRATELIVELPKTLIRALQEGFPEWRRAFLRFDASDGHHGSTGSYVTEKGVFLFDAMTLEPLFKELNGQYGIKIRLYYTYIDSIASVRWCTECRFFPFETTRHEEHRHRTGWTRYFPIALLD